MDQINFRFDPDRHINQWRLICRKIFLFDLLKESSRHKLIQSDFQKLGILYRVDVSESRTQTFTESKPGYDAAKIIMI